MIYCDILWYTVIYCGDVVLCLVQGDFGREWAGPKLSRRWGTHSTSLGRVSVCVCEVVYMYVYFFN